MPTHRTHFVDKSVLYLFSVDAEFTTTFEQIGIVPGGARVNVFAVPDATRVYNIIRDRTIGVPGYSTLTGSLAWGEDTVLVDETDVVTGSIRGTIRTDDGSLIDMRYQATLPLVMGAFRAIAGGVDAVGTAERPLEHSFVITPRYETEVPRYRWLCEHQCIGFARVQQVSGIFRRISYDVYAMT
jgi:hypothetical protein